MGGMLSQYIPHAVSNTGGEDFGGDLKKFLANVPTPTKVDTPATGTEQPNDQKMKFYPWANADEQPIVDERATYQPTTDRQGLSQPRSYGTQVANVATNQVIQFDFMNWVRDNCFTIMLVELIIIAVLIIRR